MLNVGKAGVVVSMAGGSGLPELLVHEARGRACDGPGTPMAGGSGRKGLLVHDEVRY
jgi:hypothetical protein